MGNTTSSVAPTMEQVSPVPNPVKPILSKWVRYHLTFEFLVVSNTSMPTMPHMIEEAKYMCLNPDLWRPYLHAAMEDAVRSYRPVKWPGSISSIRVRLLPSQRQGCLHGSVEWVGRRIEQTAIEDAIQWRIGERMACSEFQSYSGDWNSCIMLNTLSFRQV
jgi:hypothetical protein